MKNSILIKKLIFASFLIFISFGINAQITSSQSGNWSSGSTWVGGVVPGNTDNVVIAAGHTVTATAAITVNNLIIEAGATFAAGTYTHTVTGNWTEDGTLTGNCTIEMNASLVQSITEPATFYNLTFKGGSVAVIGANTTVNNDFIVTNNTELTTSYNLTVGNNFTVDDGSKYSCDAGTTIFNSSSAQTITIGTTDSEPAANFYAINFDNGGAGNPKTVFGDIVANTTLYIYDDAVVNDDGDTHTHKLTNARIDGTCNFSGTLNLLGGTFYNGSGDASFTMGTAKIIVEGTPNIQAGDNMIVNNNFTIESGYLVINNNATLTGQAGDILLVKDNTSLYIRGTNNFPTGFGTITLENDSYTRYDANINQTITARQYGRLVLSQQTKTAAGSLDVNGSLYLYNAVILDLVNYDHTFAGYIYNWDEDWGNGSITTTGGTVTLDAADAEQRIYNAGTGSYTFNNLVLTQSAPTTLRYKRFYDDITINGNFTATNTGGDDTKRMVIDFYDHVISGTSTTNAFSLGPNVAFWTSGENSFDNMMGDFANWALDVYSTIRYNRNDGGQQYISDYPIYGNIELYGNGAKNFNRDIDVDGNVLRVGGTPVLTATNRTMNVAGNWTLNQNYTNLTGSNLIIFDGATTQTISNSNFNNVQFSNSGSVKTQTGTWDIAGNLTIDDGVAINSDQSTTIEGNWTEAGTGTFQQTGGTVTFDGDAAQTVTSSANSYFYNFYIDKQGTSKLVTANSALDVNGTFNFAEGYANFDLNGQNLHIERDFNFREGCTFTHNNGKVFFDGENYAQLIRNYNTDTIVFNDVEFVGTAVKRLYNNAFRFEGDVFINNSTLDGQHYEHFVEGDWTNTGVFRHSSNLHFDGGNQTISQSSFNTVIFGGGANTKTLAGDIVCNGNLIIDDATLDVSGSNYNISVENEWRNDSTGSFIARQGKVTLVGDWNYFYTGESNNDRPGYSNHLTTQGGTKSFYDLEINMREDTWLIMRGDLHVANDLTITKGQFRKSYDPNNYGINDITVGGSFSCHGDFIDDNYGAEMTLNPSSGTHTFDPGDNNTYCPITFDGAASSSYTFESNLTLHTDRALIINNGTIDLNSNGIQTNGTSGDISLNNGTLELDSAAYIDMGNASTFTNAGGVFKLTGHADDPAKIFATTGNYTFVQTSGTMHASNYRVEGTSGNGIDIQGGSIDATNTFQNGTFSNGAGTAYLTTSGIDIGSGGRTLQGVIFNSGPTYNVQRTSGTGVLTFENATGSLAGEANENDVGNLIDWTYPGADFWTGDGDGTHWNDADNWASNSVPDINTIVILDHANVAATINVEISTIANGAAKSLLINAAGGNPITLTLNGQELQIAEDITIGLGTTLTQTNPADIITLGGSWSNEGTFNENSSTVVFNPTSGTHSISTQGAADSFNNLHINGTGGTVNVSSTLDVTGNVELLGATLNGGSYTLTLAGNWVKNGGVFVPGTGTVNFNNAGAQTIGGGDFYNFITSGSGTKTLSANVDIANDITIESGSVLDGAINFIYIGDDWTNNAGSSGFTQSGAGTVIFNSKANTQDIGSTAAVDASYATTFNNLTISGTTTKNFQQNTTVNGDLIISGGSPHVLDDVTVTGSGTNTLSQTAGTFFIRGTNNFPTSFETISLTGGWVDYYADADQTIYPTDYYNLRLRNINATDGNIYNRTLAGDITVNYIQIYDTETRLVVGNNTITLASDLWIRDGGIEPTWGANGTIIQNGGSWYVDNDITTLNNVIKKNNGYLWLRYNDLTITGDVSIQDDAILRMDTTTMNCTGANKTFTMAASARAYIYTDDVSGAPDTVAFPTNFANYDLDVNSTVYLRGSNNQIIYTTPTYGNLYIYTDAEIDLTLDGNLDVNGDFRMYYDDPTLIDGGHDMNLAGSYIDLRKYTPTAGTTITFDGVDQRVVDAAAGATECNFANLVFAGSGQKSLYNGGDDWYNVSENLTINSGVTLYLPRRLDFSGSTWLNNGTFNHTAYQVNFTGTSAQSIDPGADNDFYAVTFSGGGTKTFTTNGIDVNNGVFEIASGTTVDMGTGLTHNIATERVSNSGTWITSSANFIFDRNGTQYLPSPAFTAQNITCRKSDQWTRYRYLEGDINVNDLNIEDGIYFLCTTNHDVANYNITLTGNFTNEGYSFRPYENTVYFESNNTDPKTITQGNGNFNNVIFNNTETNSRTYTLQDQGNFYEDLTINSGATLDLNGQILRLGNDDSNDPVEPPAESHTINAGGTLDVDAGASLQFSCYDLGNTTLDVYGTLKIVGTDGNNATVTQYQRHRDNRIDINIQNGGTIHANYYLMQYISNDGFVVQDGATIDPTNNFSNGTWSDMNTSAASNRYYLVCDANVSSIGTVDNVTFNFSGTPTQGSHFNVQRATGSTGTLQFGGSISGLLGGVNYEADDVGVTNPGLITWPPVSEVTWDGSVSTDWFDADNWTPATVPTSTITAIIPQEANNPVINNTTGAICKDLQITDGFLTLQGGYDLEVKGDVYVGTGTNVGILAIDNTGCTINASGSWTRGQNALFVHGDGTVIFDAAGGNVSIDARNSAFGNVEFNGGATFLFTRLETLVDDDFTITNGTVSPTVNDYRIKIKGNYNNVGGTYSTVTPGYVYFDANGDQTITNGTFWDLTIDGSGTKSTVNAMTVDGDLLIQNATLQAGAPIDFNSYYALIESTGTFNDGGFAHTFGGYRWTGTGAYTGNGSLTFDRDGGQQIYASKFSSLKLENNGTVTLYGNVTLTGNLEINEPNQYLNIQDYTLINTSGTGAFSMEDTRRIYVRGANNFPSGFSAYDFHENSYTMYDGTMAQTIAATPVIYGRVYLDNSAKTLAGNVDIDGILYFYDDASLDVTSNNYRINIEGDWYNTEGATFTPHEGEVIFDGNDDNTYLRVYEASKDSNPFYKLTVNKGNGYLRSYWTDITVQDNLRVLNGILYQNQTMYVGGDMSALSGTFYQAGTYYLNKASGSSNLQVNGSILNNLTINSDATYYLQDDLQLYGNFTLTKGTFDGNGNVVGLGNYGETQDISGTYIVGAGGTLKLPNYGTFEVNSGGVVYIVGDASNVATVTNYDGRYYFNIESGGKIYAENYMFEYMAEAGIYIKDGGIIDNNNNFSNGTFTNVASGGTALRIENSQSFSEAGGNPIEGVSFPVNPNGGAHNIMKVNAAAGTIDFKNYTGEFAGETFDSDPNDLINWIDPPVVTWTGDIDNDWYKAGNWLASTGGNRVPLISDNVIIPQETNQPVITSDGAVAKSINLHENAYLTLNSAAATDTTLKVAEDFDFAGTFIMTDGDDTLAVGGNYNNTGSFQAGTGTVILNSIAGNQALDNYTSSFYNLHISSEAAVLLSRNTTVNNEIRIKKGTFDVSANRTLTVKGDFYNSDTYNAQHGKLILSGTLANQVFNPGSSSYYNIDIDAGASTTYNLTDNNLSVTNIMTVNSGTFNLNSLIFNMGDGVSDVLTINGGTFSIDENAYLRMANEASVVVNNGGTFRMVGTDVDNPAYITSQSGTYAFTANSGSTIHALYYNVQFVNADGLYLRAGANIDGTNNFSNGVFRNGTSGGQFLWFQNDLASDITVTGCYFHDGASYNMKRQTGNNAIIFEDALGLLEGSAHEIDDGADATGRVQWTYTHTRYTWTGATNTDWNTATNWDVEGGGHAVPDGHMIAIIPDVTNDPILNSGANAAVYDLRIENGGFLTLDNDYDLDADNTVMVGSGGTMTVANGSASTISVADIWSIDGAFNHGGSSTVVFDAPAGKVLTITGASIFNNLTINSSGAGTAEYNTASSMIIEGNFTITQGIFSISSANDTLHIGGDWVNSSTFNHGNAIVDLNGGNQSISNTGTGNFYSLECNGSATKTLSSNVSVEGDLLISNGVTLAGSSYTLTASGDWTNRGTFSAGTGIVYFAGTSPQVVDNNTENSFYNFTLNNTASEFPQVLLYGDIRINNGLTMTDGVIETTITEELTISDNATLTGGSTSASYVSGPITKEGDDDFIFPTGDGLKFARLGISGLSSNASLTAQYFENPYTDITSIGPGIDHVSGYEYWNLDRNNGTGEPKVTLYWDDGSQSGIDNLGTLLTAQYTVGQWEDKGQGSTTGDISVGTITSSSAFTSFGEITFASSVSNQNPLNSFAQWTGSESVVWNNANNWIGGVPTASKSARIASGKALYPEIDIDAECSSLTLENGASLTVNPTKSLTVNGTFSLDGTFTLKSDATGNAALINMQPISYGTSSLATAELYISSKQYHYVSTPVRSSDAHTDIFKVDASAPYLNHNFYSYDETNTDADWMNGWSEYTGQMQIMQGYSYYMDRNTTVYYRGEFTTGNRSIAITYTDGAESSDHEGWNFVGNPYPAPIDWDATGWTKNNVDNAIYFWNGTNYSYYVGATGHDNSNGTGTNNATNIIPAMQGFMVKSTGAGSLGVPESARTTSSQAFYKKKNLKSAIDIIRINVSIDGKKDETAIRFNKDATSGFDSKFDAYKLFPNDWYGMPQIYSVLDTVVNAAINTLPGYEDETIIPLGFQTPLTTGVYTINIPEFSIEDLTEVYFEDLYENQVFDLSTGLTYNFTSADGQFSDRFRIKFSVEGTTGIEEDDAAFKPEVQIFSSRDMIYLKSATNDALTGVIEVYNLLGVVVKRIDNTNEKLVKIKSENPAGYYIIKLRSKYGIYSKKVLITK